MYLATLPEMSFDFAPFPGGREGFIQQWFSEGTIETEKAQQLSVFEVAPTQDHALMHDDFMLGLLPKHQLPQELTKVDAWCLIEHIDEPDSWVVYPAQIDDYTKDGKTPNMLVGLSVMARSAAEPKLANWTPASAYCKFDASGMLSNVLCILKRKN